MIGCHLSGFATWTMPPFTFGTHLFARRCPPPSAQFSGRADEHDLELASIVMFRLDRTLRCGQNGPLAPVDLYVLCAPLDCHRAIGSGHLAWISGPRTRCSGRCSRVCFFLFCGGLFFLGRRRPLVLSGWRRWFLGLFFGWFQPIARNIGTGRFFGIPVQRLGRAGRPVVILGRHRADIAPDLQSIPGVRPFWAARPCCSAIGGADIPPPSIFFGPCAYIPFRHALPVALVFLFRWGLPLHSCR